MPALNIQRPPGLYDRLPQDVSEFAHLTTQLQDWIARFGYQSVETPILEYADLFLTKSGDQAVNRLFNFELRGRQFCLRSEFTPSAARLYTERFQHQPKPIRWQFVGPVFRYESPQRSHSRQFTMLGTELIGQTGIVGDAETIGLAATGLIQLGLTDWIINIGHVGLVALFLDQFGLDRRMRRFFVGQIENLRHPKRGRAYVEEQLEAQLINMAPPVVPDSSESTASPYEDSLTPSSLSIPRSQEMGEALRLLLTQTNLITAGSSRTPEDIARRLLIKQERSSNHAEYLEVLTFLERLTSIDGTPEIAFPALRELIELPEYAARFSRTDVKPNVLMTIKAFQATVDLLSAYGVPREQVRIDMGMARGLNYYTGIVFEMHTPMEDSSSQLCGGGRYDDLIGVLGATQDTPAIGFAYGLERILQELQRVGYAAPADTNPHVIIYAATPNENDLTAKIAMKLRLATKSIAAEVAPSAELTRVEDLARIAKRTSATFIILMSDTNRADQHLTLFNASSNTTTVMSIDAAIEMIHDFSPAVHN